MSVRQVYGADAVEVATPRLTPRLDSLPGPEPWRPGDPIKYIPKRTYPAEPPRDPVNPTDWTIDPLLSIQAGAQATDLPDGPGAFGTPSVNVAGQGFSGVYPPDTVGDVGPNHYLQAINTGGGSSIVIHLKNGNVSAGPFVLDGLGSGGCASGLGDPIILYDRLADRWMLSEFSGTVNALCVYVSQTPDPAGSYFAYQFNTPGFPDYPKYGVWPDAYYISTNESSPAVYALDRVSMLMGSPATRLRTTAPSLAGFPFQALTPADLDGASAPPAGAPGIFLRHRDDEVHNPGSNDPTQDFIEIWQMHVDFVTPGNSWFTGPTNIAITEIDSDLCGLSSFSCFPQPAGSALDPLREVVMWRAQYRNFGTHESLVGNLVTDVDGTDHGGIRWFELRKTGASWSLHQEGTYSIDSDSRWMGSIAMDGDGNMALGHSVASTTQFADIRYTGRLATEPPGTMPQGEHLILAGAGSQSSVRWGDYSSMSVDPADDCTFWYTHESVNVSNLWATQIAAFGFPGCGVNAVCGNALIEPPEACDDGNTDPGDGCSAVCQIEPGFICSGEPSVCEPDPTETCLAESFDTLGDWTTFNLGALDWDWGITDDGVCWSGNLGPPPALNVTGGAGQAACIDSDAAGNGEVVAFLCSSQFYAGDGEIDLSLLVNYQIFGAPGADDFFAVLMGTDPPGPGTIAGYSILYYDSANLGGFAALPGAELTSPISEFAGLDAHICFGYGGDFDWYAQVDEVEVVASLGCNAVPDTDGDGVLDDVDNCTLIPNPAQVDTNMDGIGNRCDADLNGDCQVDAADYSILGTMAYQQGPSDGDFNVDSVVNPVDIGLMRTMFGQPPGPSAAGGCR